MFFGHKIREVLVELELGGPCGIQTFVLNREIIFVLQNKL
jgi:hypothetical protein